MRRFWVPERGLLSDDEKHLSFSEHAQCLALLNGVLSAAQAKQCFSALLEAKDLHRATVYFSFYLFEAFRQQGRGDLIVDRFGFWKDLVKQGFKTPVEMPEPSRSDCHAWAATRCSMSAPPCLVSVLRRRVSARLKFHLPPAA
jgi:hypothetical protein